MWFKIFVTLFVSSILLPSTLSQFDFGQFLVDLNGKCNKSQFQCGDDNCILKELVCDGKAHCIDNSDEAHCGTTLKPCSDPTYVQCHDKKCVSNSSVCNGVKDCAGGEDEKNCHSVQIMPKCPGKFFLCKSGLCIPPRWVCDSKKDCPDGDDESVGCSLPRVIRCEDEEFKCKNHKCIPKLFVCDGKRDCDDNSDEEECVAKAIDFTNCTLSNGKFACTDSSKCIDFRQTCNKIKDCSDGSDENPRYCESKELCKNCTHECVHTITGPACLCKEGFRLETSNNSCVDVNECLIFGKCDQKCTNTIGSYNCSCYSPYVLQSDGHTCKVQDGEALLLYSASDKIVEVFLSSNHSSVIVDHISHALGVATGGRYIYWTVIRDENRAIMRAQSDGSEPEEIVTTGVDHAEGLAIDWITLNVYFTDAGKASIGVCSKTGFTCLTLHNEDIDKPRGIALAPTHGLMFWTDWGKRPLIARSGMDGSEVMVFVGGNIHWPNGVTVDEPAERVYWLEAKLQRIETIKFDTTDRRVILEGVALHPYSIAVHENQIYWSESTGQEIFACNKFDGRNRRSVVRDPKNYIFGLHVHHHLLKQRTNVANPCNGAPCTGLCLLQPSSTGTSFRCACPEGETLAINGHECIPQGAPQTLVATSSNRLFVISYCTLGRPRVYEAEINLGHITTTTYDSKRNQVIMFDSLFRVLFAYNLHTRASEKLYSYGMGEIDSLYYDEVGDNLYWCDWYSLSIEVLNLNTRSHMVVISKTDIEVPSELALAPELDYMFVAMLIRYHHIEIYRYSMSGSVVSRILLTEVNGGATSIRLHYSKELQRLFYTTGRLGTIESIDVNGGNHQILFEREVKDFTLSNGMLFWLEYESSYIFAKSPNDTEVTQSIKVVSSLTSLTALQKPVSLSPCAIDNGGCSHLCLVSHQSKTKQICACPSGLALSVDDKNCVTPRSCNDNEYQCLTGECISQRKVCDKHEDCVHGDDERKSICGADLRCPAEQFLCANKRKCVDNSRRCDGKFDCVDGSDEVCNSNCTKFNDKYLCVTGECIDIHFRCDNKVDCKGGLDELNCHSANCSQNEFRCLSGQCIPIEWECDSEPDCVDGSDESPKCRGSSCFKEEFQCDNQRCVDVRLTCNGVDDCGDNSDEMNCRDYQHGKGSHLICNPHKEFHCPAYHRPCLPLAVRCNGTVECPDGSDEKNCTATPCIEGEEFYCVNSRKCISSQWLCDDYNDCGDNSDEAESVCSLKTLPNKKCIGFQCKSGECVSLLKVCDSIPDCKDRSDEGKQCGTPCAQFDCEYKCLQTPHGPQCLCKNGFSLDPRTNKTCVDIDECSQNMCSQLCKNTVGSFECSCHTPNYILRSDHVSCKARGHSMIFVAASDMSIDIFSNNLKHKTELNLTTNLLRTIRGIDADSFHKSVFILMEDDVLWRAQFLLGGLSDQMRLPGVTCFTHDWITQNIYYVEEHVAIKVIEWNSTDAIQIYHTNGSNYMWALAIDPHAGYIFWYESDANMDLITGRIRRADATGANPITIIDDMEYGVRQLVVDSFGGFVYWINRLDHSIHRANYDGSHGTTWKAVDEDAVAFTYFENHVYLVTRHLDKFGVKRCKIYGAPPRKCEIVKISLNFIHFLTIMQENRQRTPMIHPCFDVQCSGICVTSPTSLMCKHFDGSVSPIVRSDALSWREENPGISFGTVLAYFVMFGFVCGLGIAYYLYRYKPKSSFLRRFHFHNSIYNRSARQETSFNDRTYILNADATNENQETEEGTMADTLAPQNKNVFLETLHEEPSNSAQFTVNTSHTASAEPLIKI